MAWERTDAPPEVYYRAAHRCLRRVLRTHLTSVGTQADIIDVILGHAGAGTGAQVYLDRTAPAVWEALVEAIRTVPAVGTVKSPMRVRRVTWSSAPYAAALRPYCGSYFIGRLR